MWIQKLLMLLQVGEFGVGLGGILEASIDTNFWGDA